MHGQNRIKNSDLLVINSISTFFGYLYANHQEIRLRSTACSCLSCCSSCDAGESGSILHTMHTSCYPTLQHHNSYNRTDNYRQWNAVESPDDGHKDDRNMLRYYWLPINHSLLHLVGLTFTYLSKMHGHSNIKPLIFVSCLIYVSLGFILEHYIKTNEFHALWRRSFVFMSGRCTCTVHVWKTSDGWSLYKFKKCKLNTPFVNISKTVRLTKEIAGHKARFIFLEKFCSNFFSFYFVALNSSRVALEVPEVHHLILRVKWLLELPDLNENWRGTTIFFFLWRFPVCNFIFCLPCIM